MRILTRNLLAEADSLSNTNADATYPVSALYANMLEEIMQGATSSSVITGTYLTDVTANCFFFGYHNLSSITVTLKDSGSSVLYTQQVNTPPQNHVIYFDEYTTIRSIEITITAAATVFIGGFSFGKYTQIYNVSKPFNITHKTSAAYVQTDGGQVLFRNGIRVKTFDIGMNKLSETEYDEFFTAYDYVLTGKTFWLDRNEEVLTRQPLFGIFSSEPETSDNYAKYDISVSFLEAR